MHTDLLSFVKLANNVQLQQLIFGCGKTGLYPNFRFMKSTLLVKYEYEQINCPDLQQKSRKPVRKETKLRKKINK